jgi:glycosyltransferase involved in cell wall biosynthesis
MREFEERHAEFGDESPRRPQANNRVVPRLARRGSRVEPVGQAADIVVLGQDPRFGGGSAAQTAAFVDGATALGRRAVWLYDEHPGLGGPLFTWRRVEALRQSAEARRVDPRARAAASLWVVAALAGHGASAARSGRPYDCWIGTTIGSEWAGRAPGLPAVRRTAAAASVRALIALERTVLRGATRLYATSSASRADIARAAGLSDRAVGILPIPVDVERFVPAAEDEWREAVARPVLVFVGRADDPRKNVPMLVEAFATVRRRFPRAVLRIVGRPPEGRLVEGIEAVGEVEDIAAELRQGAVLVLPSRQEGFGIVAAEALASGLPVVTTPSGGPEDLVRRSGSGRVATCHGAAAFADAIESALVDVDVLATMRRDGRRYAEAEHAPAVFRRALASVLEQVDRA